MAGRRRIAAAVALALAGLGALGAVLVSAGSPSRKAAGTGLAPGETTATVTRRTLSESSTVDGTLGYASSLELYDRLAGTFTWLPAVGAVIARGGTLYRVDDLPVTLMYGSVPAYRALKQGVTDGPDVAELNSNMVALGFDPYGAISAGDHFGSATDAAVRRWQKARGLAQTGEVPLGRIVFAPGARRVTAVHVALGQDPPGASASDAPGARTPTTTPTATTPTATTSAATTPAATTPTATTPMSTTPTATTPTATTPTATTPAATTPATTTLAASTPSATTPGSTTPAPEAAKPNAGGGSPKGRKRPGKGKRPVHRKPTGQSKHPASSPASSKRAAKSPSEEASSKSPSGGKESGGGGKEPSTGAGELVLSTTSTKQIVQLEVKAEQQQLAHVGEPAPVTLPGGEVVHGRITAVGTAASESEDEKSPAAEKGGGGGGGGESATIAVTVALEHRVARLDQAPVSVELVKEVRRHVLTVPATALTATAGGGYAIELLEAGRLSALAVTPGMFADGYVQIEGPGVRAGLTVTQSQ
jgi:hypothetical protein